ncbi:FO synthase subunit 1 [Durusdinium trenchii]|uniref:FO synthase subunit 1 n=1 Tax=Durusdinium trenchii TaxID=1381693 RepID=A0ABP0QHK4_9DINO
MVKKASSLVFYEEDNYAGSELVVGGKLSRKRTRKMSLNIDTARAQNFEERHLPPGCMKDHYETFRTLTGPNAASFKTFWKVWHEQFSFLKFRPTSSHAQCSACCRHKLLIRGLSNHLAARKFQIKLLGEHLLNQYRDRQIYWSLRGQARLKPSMSLVAIIDSMDQMKFQYPRTPLAYSKDLSALIRPKLHLTACIAHGFSLMFFVAKHNHPKDSSLMAEIVRGFLAEAVPVALQGLQADQLTDEFWKLPQSTFMGLPEDYREHLRKYVPTLRSYNLDRAATHIEEWLNDELQLKPLLDVAAYRE